MPGVKISNLDDGGALQNTDAFPVARGSTTRKIVGSQLLTPQNFVVQSTPTIGLNWNSSTRTLQASATSAVTSFNTVNSPTIGLNWNSSTRTLSANVNDSSITNAKIAFDGGSFCFRNKIINGDMRISQRGTSFSGITLPGLDKYTLDRFIANSTSSGVVTVTQDTSAPTATKEFGYSLKCQVTTADTSLTSSEYVTIYQKIEGFNVRDLINSTFTLSFWVRSSKTGIHSVAFRNGTTFPNYDASYVVEYTINAANTWEYKTITVNGGINNTVGTFWNFTNGGGLSVLFTIAAASNVSTSTLGSWQALNRIASTNQVNVMDTVGNTFFITGVQLEEGPVATPFEHRPIGLELSLCQRYYETGRIYVGFAIEPDGTSGSFSQAIHFNTSKRTTTPTMSSNFIPGTGDYSTTLFDSWFTLHAGGASFSIGNLLGSDCGGTINWTAANEL